MPIVNDNLKAAHRRAFDVLKAGRGDFPVGLVRLDGATGGRPRVREELLERARYMHEGQYLENAQGDDFIGVQAYSRTRLERDAANRWGPKQGVELVAVDGLRVLAAGARSRDPSRRRGHAGCPCT